MSAIPFDAFAFTHTLVDAGVPDKQADSIAQAFNKAIQESNAAVIEQVKRDYRLGEIITNKDLDVRITQTELKIKDAELRIINQLAAIQQDVQNTKITNRALLGVGALILGTVIKIAFFTH